MSAPAARLDDPIEHSSALDGLLAGLAIGAGAVLIGIAVVGTGGWGLWHWPQWSEQGPLLVQESVN